MLSWTVLSLLPGEETPIAKIMNASAKTKRRLRLFFRQMIKKYCRRNLTYSDSFFTEYDTSYLYKDFVKFCLAAEEDKKDPPTCTESSCDEEDYSVDSCIIVDDLLHTLNHSSVTEISFEEIVEAKEVLKQEVK